MAYFLCTYNCTDNDKKNCRKKGNMDQLFSIKYIKIFFVNSLIEDLNIKFAKTNRKSFMF